MRRASYFFSSIVVLCIGAMASVVSGQGGGNNSANSSRTLFEDETFGGNGRTCRTCHSKDTGTTSPADALRRFQKDSGDPLFLHDGSDDGNGQGVSRMLSDATVLITITVAPNIIVDGDPSIRTVTLRRGIPTTLNVPSLENVFMLDGRQPTLEQQAAGAIHDHAQNLVAPTGDQLSANAAFQKTNQFFSSPAMKLFAAGGPAPGLPQGRTASEKRGRRFFEDVFPEDNKHGFCGACHAGPLLNQTNAFLEFIGGPPAGSRFQNILTSALNVAGNPTHTFTFDQGTPDEFSYPSPDPGVALITGMSPAKDPTGSHGDAFKIPQLRGIRHTAPYFHDNSAKTLEDVLVHYKFFFELIFPGDTLTDQDQQDIIAYLKILD